LSPWWSGFAMCSLPSPEHDYLLVYKPPNRFIPLPLTNDHARGRPFRLARVSPFSNLSTSRIVNKASHSSTPRERTSRDPPRVNGSSRTAPPDLVPGLGDHHPTKIPPSILASCPALRPFHLPPDRGFLGPYLPLPGDPLPHGYNDTDFSGQTLTAYLSLRPPRLARPRRILPPSGP
jgi:hypothetical protein